ncbi:tyrosine-protein phosphatase [Candidatus Babeliales bacterium]|nr:tyrosine-protein phosphatase [Candidatus Babeliales bacterium]
MLKKLQFLCFLLIFLFFFSESNAKSFFSKLSDFNQKNVNSLQEVFNNFYTVEKNKLYRSKQLDASTLKFYIKKFGIKTVVNLRGENKNRRWWQREYQATRDLNINFFNIPMSAMWMTSREHLKKLFDIYDDQSLYPILIHCQGGADRTGEAAALWVLEKQGKSKKEALNQLSIKFGHRKYKNSAKDFLIEIWQGRQWAFYEYDPRDYPDCCHKSAFDIETKKLILI